MLTENLSTLKIHKLTQKQYDRELAAGRLDEAALYLTPDEPLANTEYVTILPETTLTFTEADVESGITLPEKLALKPNTIYLVNWNGIEYEYKSSDGYGYTVYLGNRTYHQPLNKRYDGYGPFRFQTYDDASRDSKVWVNSAGTYTVSISEVVFHQIDPRYYKQLAYVDYDVIYPAKTISVTETTTVTTPSNAERTCYWYQLLSADNAGWVTFDADSTYLVNWNGAEYECKCNDLADGIGDPYWFGDADELTSGEPFFLFHSFDDGLWVYTGDSGECTIKISEEVIHKIDKRYLPDIDGSHVVLQSPNGTYFTITVSDDGILTAKQL